jgi:4-hydroxy-2-oxoheptanedioate aldolase
MDLKKNAFKAAIREFRLQRGIWCAMSDPLAAEMMAGCGYDWMLFDTEHAPTDTGSIVPLLQAVAPYPVSALVRPTCLDPAMIKKFLDVGVQTILVPYVQTPEEAALAVASVTYPPEGIRGVAGMTRASGFGQVAGYHAKARDEICIMIQVETRSAMDQLDAIAATPGLDGIFIGPADLGASMGFPGQPGHPEVKAAVLEGIRRIRALGLPPGVLTMDAGFAEECIEAGAVFVTQDLDMVALRRGLSLT